jgi:hypothetical protein|tara:strand:- start:1873 stop:3705 length:1833 start_codon:yes stop_codon:yes gene_type:complete
MIVFDVEADNLLDDATKIHCLSYTLDGSTYETLYDYNEMRELVLSQRGLIGHNIIRYDVPLLERLLGIKITASLFDTLPMSWVLNYNRPRHGLESFGEDFGIPKPEITDWTNLSQEEYAHRCTEDVKINWQLWYNLLNRFMFLYNKDKTELNRFFRYLHFKMDCAREAEQQGWKLDVQKAESTMQKLIDLQDKKIEELISVMPMRKIMSIKTKPKVFRKKDDKLSANGRRWLDLLEENGLPSSYNGEVSVVKGVEEANPMSSDQVKDWLTGLGWKPCTFKEGSNGPVPQVRKGGELTASVRLLIDNNPTVEVLDGLTVLQHRLSIFKGFLECQRNGYVKAEIAGLTNTLRFKHSKPLVNLPGVDKPWGAEIRGCLTAPEGYVLCGADMTSLEDTTKRHYMHPYDPDYVAEMSQDGFDPHLDLAKHAGAITQYDIDEYNKGNRPELKTMRKNYKVVNYSATYGVGANKLSRETGMSTEEAKALLEAYWNRNWSVKKFSESQRIRTINTQMWVQNPVSKFWYSLRFEKDAFSTINQGTGAYCFDRWVALYRLHKSNIVGQFHDESINVVRKGEENEHTSILQWAIEKLNEQLKLNVDLGIDVQYGQTYADVH